MAEQQPLESILSSSTKIATGSPNRQIALERELTQLTRINSTIANLIETVKFTNSNIAKINESGNNTHTLLDQWIRILSQTNFTHDIINDPNWNGVEDQQDDDTVERELAQKSALEQQLLNDLSKLESENSDLAKRIENRENEKELINQRKNEMLNRRKRELGLYNVNSKDSGKRRK
ncbi:DASH complex subunit Duo1-domain-containing protein [Scheffersomyces xylosifermentans]|uniref:DASH complex subunit Duo1-domain-containing protein n=1 Tax=Scheffersomyces xylosifermentans TaxID=1304137 RepID=UPI00315E0152